MAISFVLFEDLHVLMLKDRQEIGGEALFMSSIVISTSLGLLMNTSYLHQVCLNWLLF